MDFPEIAKRTDELARRYSVPGARLALHRNGRTDSVEIGVSADTRFPLGSTTKAFTAALAMILVADGDIEWDAPIGEHLPERFGKRCPSLDDRVTLRMLLSHTSGLMSDHDSAEGTGVSAARLLLECCEQGLDYRPGNEFSYSNVGYLMAGQVVESVTGMGWHEAVEAILLRPLGITPAFTAGAGGPPPGPVATGHAVHLGHGTVRAVEQTLPAAEAAVGALALTATDLVRFGRMFTADGTGPLDPGAAAMMLSAVEPEPFGLADAWGAGLAAYDAGSGRWWGHDGTADGAVSCLRISPADGTVVAFTANANTGLRMWEDLVAELRALGLEVANHSYSSPREAGDPVPAPPGAAGSYFNGASEYRIRVDDGGGVLTLDGEPHSELTFFDGLLFTLRPLVPYRPPMVGRFRRDPVTGGIDRMHLSGRLAVRR